MQEQLEKLVLLIKQYHPDANFDKIQKAFEFAQIAHKNQKRLSGEPVFNHLYRTASVLAEWRLDTDSIVAGLLHDVVEDTSTTLEKVEKEFGSEVAKLVNGVTKIGGIKFQGRDDEEFCENLRKLILVMAKDLRVVFIKLADRLHNMQTLSFLPREKQIRIARETLDIYAPLAERLGIEKIKHELEDLAFPYVYPQDYQWLLSYTQKSYLQADEILTEAKEELENYLRREKIIAEVKGRKKHYYSLWRKLLRPEIDKNIGKIFDLIALRILVPKVSDCYAALGIVHSFWRPVPSEGISDFIAQPKPNGYRSIHTRVFGPHGKIIEIQIRTYEMHQTAESGVAAHWFYSQLKNQSIEDQKIQKGFFAPDSKMTWIKQLVSWQREIIDSTEFLDALKLDAFHTRIYVFSPKGDVFELPENSTPIDFAYAVHTSLGDRAMGARINGKLVGLNEKLKSGQIVEIIVDKNRQKPSRDWLSFVVTQQAKKRIARHFFN